MCIETIEPNLPLYTLLCNNRGDRKVVSHNKRGILTTDYDSLLQYAMLRAKLSPLQVYTISRVNTVMEL